MLTMKYFIQIFRRMSPAPGRVRLHFLPVLGRNLVLSVALIVAVLGRACAPVLADAIGSCGIFTFQGSSNYDGATIDNKFSFQPSQCQSDCLCDRICYIQIVRAIDSVTGEPQWFSDQQWNRMVTGQSDALLNYWAIDRIDDRIWGYYGMNDNGSFDSYLLKPGNNREPAELGDDPKPKQDTHPIKFEAIDVTVCINEQSGGCVNNILGCYYYCFTIGDQDAAGNLSSHPGAEWNKKAVELAVQEWNKNVGSKKKMFPQFKWLAK